MSLRKHDAEAPASIRLRGSLEVSGLWFEGVYATVDRAASLANMATVGHLYLDEASAGMLAPLTGQPALLTIGDALQIDVAFAPDPLRPGRFTFHALPISPGAE